MEFFSNASGTVEPLYSRHLGRNYSFLIKGVGSFQGVNLQVVNIEVSSFVYRGVFISLLGWIRGMHFRGLE